MKCSLFFNKMGCTCCKNVCNYNFYLNCYFRPKQRVPGPGIFKPWHFWNEWSLGCFLIVIFYTEVTKTLKHELFLSFLCHSSHNNTPFFYQTNDNDILCRPYKDQVLEGILFDGCFQDMLIFDIYQLEIWMMGC